MFDRSPLALPALLALALLHPLGANAQNTCLVCSMRFEEDVVLDFTDAPASPTPDITVVELHNGTFALTSPASTGIEIFLHDSEGRFIRSIGTEGEGPGEFAGSPRIGVPMTEGFLAHDATLERLHFIGNDGDVQWTQRMPIVSTRIHRAGQNLIGTGMASDQGVVYGMMVAALDPEGTDREVQVLRHSLELDQTGQRPDWHHVGTDHFHVWAMRESGGPLYMLDQEGLVITTYNVPLESIPGADDEPTILGIGTGEHVVWIHQVAAIPEDQRSATGEPLMGEVGTRITAYDPNARQIVATEWLEGMVRPVNMNRVVQAIPEPTGGFRITVGDLRLRER